MPRRIASQEHEQTRALLRIIGPLVLLMGIILTLIGVGSFFSTAEQTTSTITSPGSPGFPSINGIPITTPDGRTLEAPRPESPAPNHFWYAFLGLPLIAIGGGICKFAYMGAVTRYVASEMAPVGKDVVNYMADGTKDAVRDLAGAVASGLRENDAPAEATTRECPACGESNDVDAKFCDSCGERLPREIVCAQCAQTNDPDAKFCDNCGAQLQP